jgi:hypothetical protein
MNKAAKAFEIIKRVLKSPGVIRELFDEEEYYRDRLKRNGIFDQGLPQVNLAGLFPGFDETVDPYSFLDGTSLPIDIALLKQCARSYMDCRYMEIGTWRGESVANVATVAGKAVTINLPDKKMLEAGLPQEYVSLHRYFSSHLKNVQHIQHDSLTFDFSALHKKQDLIFVDGDHHYESVKSDTENAFKCIAGDESTIVWHDYAFSPESIRWTVLAGILAGCPPEKRKFLYQVSNTMCAIFTTRPLKTVILKPFQQPDKYFSVRISMHKT